MKHILLVLLLLPTTLFGAGAYLVIQRTTGQARIQNDLGTTVLLSGYQIQSTGGNLIPAGFVGSGVTGFASINPQARSLAELSLTATIGLTPNTVVNLGPVFPVQFSNTATVKFLYTLQNGAAAYGNVVLQ